MNDLISRQAVIDALADMYYAAERWGEEATDGVIKARAESCMASLVEMKLRIEKLPSAQPEQQSRIEKELHGLTPQQQYNFLDSLMHKKSVGWNSTALYVTAWLNGEED